MVLSEYFCNAYLKTAKNQRFKELTKSAVNLGSNWHLYAKKTHDPGSSSHINASGLEFRLLSSPQLYKIFILYS